MQTATRSLLLKDIANKLTDPDAVRAFAIDPLNGNPDPLQGFPLPWSDLSLAGGYPSLLLFFASMEQVGLVEEEISYRYVVKIKEAIEEQGFVDLSTFSGVAGVAWSLQMASRGKERYARMIEALHTYLLDKLYSTYLYPMQGMTVVPSGKYDVIQGICGIGRYCLEQMEQPRFLKASADIVQALIAMCQPISVEGHTVAGWYVSPSDILNHAERNRDRGTFNTGLSHGVAGVLAFLSIAWLKGLQLDGQEETMASIAEWLRARSFQRDGLTYWKGFVSWEEELKGECIAEKSSQDAWCYGVPSITRSLFLYGKAINSDEIRLFAKGVFKEIFSRAQEEWRLPGPCLCHGIAGLLLLTHQMSLEKECEDFSHHVEHLVTILMGFFSPSHPFGFQDIEPCQNGDMICLSKPGLLEGAVGVLLALLSLEHPNVKWHVPFLISE